MAGPATDVREHLRRAAMIAGGYFAELGGSIIVFIILSPCSHVRMRRILRPTTGRMARHGSGETAIAARHARAPLKQQVYLAVSAVWYLNNLSFFAEV